MKVTGILNRIKQPFYALKQKINQPTIQNHKMSGTEALSVLGEQNKTLAVAYNQIKPLKTHFKSTKEMYAYARKRCTDALKSNNPYEHTVVVDTKQNKVLAEYVGDKHACHTDNINSIVENPDYTISFHGHPDNYPISSPDVNFLLSSNINQEIAINETGHFSLVAKRLEKPNKKDFDRAKEFYENAVDDIAMEYDGRKKEEGYKVVCHLSLKEYANKMGLRYVTNYPYLKKW